MFDEQPGGDIHGECAAEIHRQECEITRLHHLSACEACIEIPAVGEYIKQIEAQRDALALQNKQMREVVEYYSKEEIDGMNGSYRVCCSSRPENPHTEHCSCTAALALPDLSTSIIKHDNDVIERCAHECEEFADAYLRTAQGNNDGMYDHMESAARELAEAIRALKG